MKKPPRWIDCVDANADFPIAIICSRFNREIVDKLLEGALSRCESRGFQPEQISVVWVPGAIEIPLTAQRLAQLGIYRAIVCLGAVVQGETQHHLYVCEQVSQGCARVALENEVPVIFGVLTTQTEALALERAGGKSGNRGSDSVDAAVEMVVLLDRLTESDLPPNL
jgi:6,7-dimethyl-8-ribityllumazine synthase